MNRRTVQVLERSLVAEILRITEGGESVSFEGGEEGTLAMQLGEREIEIEAHNADDVLAQIHQALTEYVS